MKPLSTTKLTFIPALTLKDCFGSSSLHICPVSQEYNAIMFKIGQLKINTWIGSLINLVYGVVFHRPKKETKGTFSLVPRVS